jgi:hypothetical protein
MRIEADVFMSQGGEIEQLWFLSRIDGKKCMLVIPELYQSCFNSVVENMQLKKIIDTAYLFWGISHL